MFCVKCGEVLSVTVAFCPKCGTAAQGCGIQNPGPSALAPSAYPGSAPPGCTYEAPPTISGLAVAGLILAFLIGIVGLILCLVAKSQIQASNGRQTGEGLATVGIVISIINMAVGLLLGLA